MNKPKPPPPTTAPNDHAFKEMPDEAGKIDFDAIFSTALNKSY